MYTIITSSCIAVINNLADDDVHVYNVLLLNYIIHYIDMGYK